MAFTDRYGLTVTTDSSVAFERFQEGMDHLLAYGPEGETRLAQAVEADPGLAVAHTGRALLALVAGDVAEQGGNDAPLARRGHGLGRAQDVVKQRGLAGWPRRRQRVAAVHAEPRVGDVVRLAVGADHLALALKLREYSAQAIARHLRH